MTRLGESIANAFAGLGGQSRAAGAAARIMGMQDDRGHPREVHEYLAAAYASIDKEDWTGPYAGWCEGESNDDATTDLREGSG